MDGPAVAWRRACWTHQSTACFPTQQCKAAVPRHSKPLPLSPSPPAPAAAAASQPAAAACQGRPSRAPSSTAWRGPGPGSGGSAAAGRFEGWQGSRFWCRWNEESMTCDGAARPLPPCTAPIHQPHPPNSRLQEAGGLARALQAQDCTAAVGIGAHGHLWRHRLQQGGAAAAAGPQAAPNGLQAHRQR